MRRLRRTCIVDVGMWTGVLVNKDPGLLFLENFATILTRLHRLMLVTAPEVKVDTLNTRGGLRRGTAVSVLTRLLRLWLGNRRLAMVNRVVLLAGQGHVDVVNRVAIFDPTDEGLEKD